MTRFLHIARSLALWLALAASWSHAEEKVFPDEWLQSVGESLDADSPPPESVAADPHLSDSLDSQVSDDDSLKGFLATYSGQLYSGQLIESPPAFQATPSAIASVGPTESGNPGRFRGQFTRNARRFDVGTDLYYAPEFKDGLILFGNDVAMKIGGYVKADFIHDFDPIDSTDSFDTTTIPVGAPDRTNTRFHARQTRLSFDTRWASYEYPVRMFVEGDFFGSSDGFRLRHAFGEVGSLLVGQTWTTFTDIAAFPATLDFEGSVSSVNRRQALIRWTQQLFHEDLTLAVAAENPQFDIVPPPGIPGESRTPSPDFVARLRISKPWGQYQIASLYRRGGFQPTGRDVVTGSAWGINFTGATLVSDKSKFYHQLIIGEGIGSYRGLPDAAPESETTDKLLGFAGWMIGYTWEWTDTLDSNLTYAENALDNAMLQPDTDVRGTTYLAANVIWNPIDRVNLGIEYLYGTLENVGRETGDAHRIQTAFIFDLP